MQNLIEGAYTPGQKVIVIEDLISTGGSSLSAVEALREAGCIVTGMVATFTYGFRISEEKFAEHALEVRTLTDYDTMIVQALESGYITESQVPLLKQWRLDPENWSASSSTEQTHEN